MKYLGIILFSSLFSVAAIPGQAQEISAREFMTRIPVIENPEDLYLDPSIIKQLETFFPHQSRSRKNLQKVIFAGVSKSLKIQATQWIAVRTRQNAFRVIPSRVVSEYAGETEKNLELVFDEAENEDAILYFDEADVLFGNKNENDENAKSNREKLVTYFLEKSDRYGTTIILSCTEAKKINPAIFKKFREVIEIKSQK
jgi:SpoVK/Ycf46/Vps4 family AAA+-type ATPase